MSERVTNDVGVAFEMLLKEIEISVERAKADVRAATEREHFEAARDAIEKASAMTEFKQKVISLRQEWRVICSDRMRKRSVATGLGRLEKGRRTRQEEYYAPILQALTEMGGAGRIGEVLQRVYQLMRSVLKPIDEEPLSSDPTTPRWRNAAQWARHDMVNEGLLKRGSPRGIWEISEQGREWLRNWQRPI